MPSNTSCWKDVSLVHLFETKFCAPVFALQKDRTMEMCNTQVMFGLLGAFLSYFWHFALPSRFW